MTATELQYKERAEPDLARFNARRSWVSICVMPNKIPRRKLVFVNDEIANANELNDLYMCFETHNHAECRNNLEGVRFNVQDNILIDPQSVTQVFKHTVLSLTRQQDQITCLLFF